MRLKSVAAIAAFTAAACVAQANTCNLWLDESAKVWRGNCKLEGPLALVNGELQVVRPQIRLAELRIARFRYQLRGNLLEVWADIRNDGTADSVATTVVANVLVTDPVNVNQMNTTVFPSTAVPVLPALSARRVLLGSVTIDYSRHDVDVNAGGMVDPILSATRPRGTNIELIEGNNVTIGACRVYGPDPDPSVGPCN